MRIAALLLVLSCPLVSLAGERPVARTAEAVRGRLAERIDVSWREVTLQAALGDLRTRLQVNIVPDWRNLELTGILLERPVTLQLRDVPAATVLDCVLATCEDNRGVDWTIRDGIVLVAPREILDLHHVVRLYDVNGLIGRTGPTGPAARLVRLADTQAREKLAGGEPNAAVFTQRGLALIDVITMTCEPDAWIDNGGMGTIEWINGLLVVHAPPRVHHRVERLLVRMAQAWRRPPPVLYPVDESEPAAPPPLYSFDPSARSNE